MEIAAAYRVSPVYEREYSDRTTREIGMAAEYRRIRAARERQSHRRRVLGRIALAILALTLIAAAVLPALAVSADAADPMRTTLIRVQEGDTLWEIAAAHGPEESSTSGSVRLIKEMNGLTDSQVSTGMLLMVPAEASPQVASR